MLNCKECGKELGEHYKLVGEWPFCPECLEKLLSQPAPSPEEPESPSSVKLSSSTAQPFISIVEIPPSPVKNCQICGKGVSEKSFKNLGPWSICLSCYDKMVPSSSKEGPPEEEKEEESPNTGPALRPGIASHLKCEGCRKNLVKGGYYTVAEKPFCPECYYTLLKIAENKDKQERSRIILTEIKTDIKVPSRPLSSPPPSSPVALSAQAALPSSPSTDRTCQACSRSLPPDLITVIQGFFICQACFSADENTALYLAKQKHYEYLQELKSQEEIKRRRQEYLDEIRQKEKEKDLENKKKEEQEIAQDKGQAKEPEDKEKEEEKKSEE